MTGVATGVVTGVVTGVQWDYLSIRFTYKGRGITKEFALLDVDGERVSGYSEKDEEAPSSLPELLALVGADGWELATHAFSETSGMHHMHFKRPRAVQAAQVRAESQVSP